MKGIARAVTAFAVLALAAPALPCGFDKTHTTTTSASAPSGGVAKTEKQKGAKTAKAEKAKAPAAQKTAAN